jgi:hypothetical protein
MSIIPDREAEMSSGAASRKFDDILARAHQLNDAKEKNRESAEDQPRCGF